MKLVHFSDAHVQLRGWRHRPLDELGPLRALATVELWKGRGRLFDGAEETLRRIAAIAQRADHAVCTGDLTQLGHAEEFARARDALDVLARDATRFTVLAGNHDRYPWNGAPSRLFEEHFPEQQHTDLPNPLRVRIVGEVALVAIDTVGRLAWPVVSQGRVRKEDLPALRAALHAPELEGLCKLVLVHHAPFLRGGRPDWPWHGLRGARSLLRVAQEGGADAILCGHVHERFLVRGPLPVVNAASSTELGKEGYFELTIRGGRLDAIEERKL
ncbi:MAG: metallophosphoesterase family protein [Myxococcales bacterium]